MTALSQTQGFEQRSEPPVRICVPTGFFERLVSACDFRAVTKNAFSRYNPRPASSKADPAIYFKILLLEYIFDVSSDALRNEFNSHPGLRAFLGMDQKPILPDPAEVVQFRVKLGWMGFKRLLDAVMREVQKNKLPEVDVSILEKRYNKPLVVALTEMPAASSSSLADPSLSPVPRHKISSSDQFAVDVPARRPVAPPQAVRRELPRVSGDEMFPAEVPSHPRPDFASTQMNFRRPQAAPASDEPFRSDVPSRPQTRPANIAPQKQAAERVAPALIQKPAPPAPRIERPPMPQTPAPASVSPRPMVPRSLPEPHVNKSVYVESTLHETARMLWADQSPTGPSPRPVSSITNGKKPPAQYPVSRPTTLAPSSPATPPLRQAAPKSYAAPRMSAEIDPLGIEPMFDTMTWARTRAPLPEPVEAAPPVAPTREAPQAPTPVIPKRAPMTPRPPVAPPPIQFSPAQSFTISSTPVAPAPVTSAPIEPVVETEMELAPPQMEAATELAPEQELAPVSSEMREQEVPAVEDYIAPPEYAPDVEAEEQAAYLEEKHFEDHQEAAPPAVQPPRHWAKKGEWTVPSAGVKRPEPEILSFEKTAQAKRFSGIQMFAKSLYVVVPLVVLFGVFVLISVLRNSQSSSPLVAEPNANQSDLTKDASPKAAALPTAPTQAPVETSKSEPAQAAVATPKNSPEERTEPKAQSTTTAPVTRPPEARAKPDDASAADARPSTRQKPSSLEAAKKEALLLHLRNTYHLDLQADQYSYEELKDILNRLEKETKGPDNQ